MLAVAAVASGDIATQTRAVIAVLVALTLHGILATRPRIGLCAVLIWLALLGEVRRDLIPLVGYTETDPLIVAAPFLAILHLLFLWYRKRIATDTKTRRWVAVLMVWMGFEALNPMQGGLLVGVSGIMFNMTPIFWFWIARSSGSLKSLRMLGAVVLTLAVVAGLVGLRQTYIGFSAAEQQWIEITKFTLAINGTVLRPMSTFCSPAEYSNFVGVGTAVAFAYFLRGHRLALVLVVFLATALFLSSARSSTFTSIGASVILWALQGRSMRVWAPRLAVGIAVIGAGGYYALHSVDTSSYDNTNKQLVSHEINGLTDPFGKSSDGTAHATLVTGGVLTGITNPIGYGLGANTMAGLRLHDSSGTAKNAEFDIATMFATLGVIGGVAFVGSMVLTIRSAVSAWNYTRAIGPLVVVAIVVASFGSWLTAGHYEQGPMVWLSLGLLDGFWADGAGLVSAAAPRGTFAGRVLRGVRGQKKTVGAGTSSSPQPRVLPSALRAAARAAAGSSEAVVVEPPRTNDGARPDAERPDEKATDQT
jgi:hypothetical protein